MISIMKDKYPPALKIPAFQAGAIALTPHIKTQPIDQPAEGV